MSMKPIKKTDIKKPWTGYQDRKRAVRKERQYILVASEDSQSSVFYFKALNEQLKKYSATIGVIPQGVGRNTQSLINYVKKNYKKWLDRVKEDVDIDDFNETWVLFDRDSFPADKFDNAIVSAENCRYKVAWSNECFELWYLLHFKDQTSEINRKQIYEELTSFLRLSENYIHLKGDKGRRVHEEMALNKDVKKAIGRAKKLYADFSASNVSPHEGNPCTLVFQLVEKLHKQIAD